MLEHVDLRCIRRVFPLGPSGLMSSAQGIHGPLLKIDAQKVHLGSSSPSRLLDEKLRPDVYWPGTGLRQYVVAVWMKLGCALGLLTRRIQKRSETRV